MPQSLSEGNLYAIYAVLADYGYARELGDTQAIADIAAGLNVWLGSLLEIVKSHKVAWIPCKERMPPVSEGYLWVANHEQLWGLATLTDGKPYHSDAFWSLLGGDSVSQMFVTHWAEVDYPDLPERR